MALEEAFQVTVDEALYASAKTVGDLEALLKPLDAGLARPAAIAEPIDFPAWNRSWVARTVRRASLPTWILPLGRVFMQLKVDGLEHLESLQGPVVFAANHQSHFDRLQFSGPSAPMAVSVAPAMARSSSRRTSSRSNSRKAWASNSATITSPHCSSTRSPRKQARGRCDILVSWLPLDTRC